MRIRLLDELVGGWSGAYVYLAAVRASNGGPVQHLVLKLDRKNPKASADERTRHEAALRGSPESFRKAHIPEIPFPVVETGDRIGILYEIAGHSLLGYRGITSFSRQQQLAAIFQTAVQALAGAWNIAPAFEHPDHPADLLERWLGFRLQPGQKIESFLRETCRLDPDVPGLIIEGAVFPNPLAYARRRSHWGDVRRGTALYGLQHGDLNVNNFLVRLAEDEGSIEGYYLIDFALFKPDMPLLYDLRYLEMSFLAYGISHVGLDNIRDLVLHTAEAEFAEARNIPVQTAGIAAAIQAGREAFDDWLASTHPSLIDDVRGQYWLAGAAAGLSYCHKAGQADEIRFAGLIYAAANLKRFLVRRGLSLPQQADALSPGGYSGEGAGRAAPGMHAPLPVPINPFIGREGDLRDLAALIADPSVRLVTLTGPGGTGKTRLALEAARRNTVAYRDGVYFVDLAAITDPDLLASTTARALGIREGGGLPPEKNLITYLADREMLLLFDNFEQIVGAASLVLDLLTAAPGVKVLVTSRIPLQVRGEREFPVRTLANPEEAGVLEPDEALKYEGPQLFLQAALAVRPGFSLTADNTQAVLDICRRLDGLPLAIEIAAARVKMLPPPMLLERLDRSLNVLVSGPRDLPARQQTLRRTIEWSFNLLDQGLQTLFSGLSVFAGGFSLEAVESVCGPHIESDWFAGLETLLDHSLIRTVQSSDGAPRFDMLQTIREFARERAAAAGIADQLRWAHLEHYFEQAAVVMGPGVYGRESLKWLARFEEELDNFRTALDWGFSRKEGVLPAATTLLALGWFMYRFGHFQEGLDLTRRALNAAHPFGPSPAGVIALISRAYICMWSGRLIEARERARAAVDMAETLEVAADVPVDEGRAYAKLALGTTLVNMGEDRAAYPHLVDAVELFDDVNLPWMKGTTLVHLANVSLGLSEFEEALRWLDMAMPYMEASGDPWNMAFTANNYGEIARARGQIEKAEEYYRQTGEWFQQADAVGDQARLVHTLGYIALHKGESSEAAALFKESLAEFKTLGNHRGIAECQAGLAAVAESDGEHVVAAKLLGAATARLKAFGGAWWPADRVEIERTHARLEEALGDDFESAWTEGENMDRAAAEKLAFATGASRESDTGGRPR